MMNLQELNQNEMTAINGGGLLDNLGLGNLGLGGLLGSNGGTNQGGLTASIGLGSLLSLSNTSNGSTTELTLGKGLSLNLESLFNSF
ncbi:hypothetical protein ACSBL2_01140 [Pedobacter sp. AW31-3R]|uniref:hypothetical protein n=1 Tax=Pedobacter sp. AW31-3R TaxID=3445781 RepID=UPI003F9F605E